MRNRALAALLGALAVAVLLQLPLPAYVQRPGPVFGLGEAVVVEGARPIAGDFLFTTVELRSADALDGLAAAFDPEAAVVSRAALLGDESEEAFVARQEAVFAEAEQLAVRLGLEAVDGSVQPADVAVRSEGVGGPSAGLLIALAVADLATDADLAAGRRIAGTGALREDGSVGPVGGVADKAAAAAAAGADVFLVPAGQEGEARAAADGLDVRPVGSVAEAVQVLRG